MALSQFSIPVLIMACLAHQTAPLHVSKLPATLEAGKIVIVHLPANPDRADSNQFLSVKLKIESAGSGTSIEIRDSTTKRLIGVISPFGLKGRTATEQYSLALRENDRSRPLSISFILNKGSLNGNERISIVNVNR